MRYILVYFLIFCLPLPVSQASSLYRQYNLFELVAALETTASNDVSDKRKCAHTVTVSIMLFVSVIFAMR